MRSEIVRLDKPVKAQIRMVLLIFLFLIPILMNFLAFEYKNEPVMFKSSTGGLEIKVIQSGINNSTEGIIMPVIADKNKLSNKKKSDSKNINHKLNINVVKKDRFNEDQAKALRIE